LTIGVVIAVRDQAEYLGEALDSIESQTRAAAQVVVVDDNSSDGTGTVARARGFNTIVGPGRGPLIARNLGAAELTTDLITFLDGDDRFKPEHHELLAAAIGDAAAATGFVAEFYDPGREEELAAKYALTTTPSNGGVLGAMLIRRTAFESLKPASDDLEEHESFGLIQRLGEVPTINDVVLERRVHGANRTIVHRDVIQAGYLRSAREAILARRQRSGEEAV
jgi:glycosyltransferase involved in cell wall biosynthesis